jgi:hypothetical protein
MFTGKPHVIAVKDFTVNAQNPDPSVEEVMV